MPPLPLATPWISSPRLSSSAHLKLWRECYGDLLKLKNACGRVEPNFCGNMLLQSVGPVAPMNLTGAIGLSGPGITSDSAENAGCLMVDLIAPGKRKKSRPKIIGLDHGVLLISCVARPSAGLVGGDEISWVNIMVPRSLIHRAFGAIDHVPPQTVETAEALSYLVIYSYILRGANASSVLLKKHITERVVDLMGLVLGCKRGLPDGVRGVRFAKLQLVLAAIKEEFRDPKVSASKVGRRLGISARYVDDLLTSTGMSFSENVRELRLLNAWRMLSDRRFDEKIISKIAFASGFADVPHFNRSFRQRFGCSPSSIR